MSQSTNITWHDSEVTKEDRQRQNDHKSAVIWFTGLSGSGKHSYRLDGDNVRHGLNKNLGFSPEDRKENIRRIGEVSKLLVDAGTIAITAFISPYREDRDEVRDILEDGEFIEVYTECSVEECEKRDPKGLYEKARSGEIKEFTGISAPYEAPKHPEITINTETQSIDESVEHILNYLKEHQYI